jgi:peptidoglycan/LPS O-acetylase OafA/YrhL
MDSLKTLIANLSTDGLKTYFSQINTKRESSPPNNNYRADIDGLRALAVMAVIFYHFGISGFSGGFVGVDVFFVISGYLITKGIVSHTQNKPFSFLEFYSRRAKRLFPALLATILATYWISFFLFSPQDFEKMSASTLFSLMGASNIYFWLNSNYFDNFASLKPLLHTWSLSVELQFYAVWPLVLVLLLRYTKELLLPIVVLAATGALISILYLGRDSAGAFFLMPFRIHEFLFGGIVVFLERVRLNRGLQNLIYCVGLILVLYPILSYDSKKTSFPGIAVLVPALGSALMILGGRNGFSAKLLSGKIAGFIGEISYSLYLVHWPIFVFASYILVLEIPLHIRLSMIFGVFLAAVIMYRCIEKPFRHGTVWRIDGKGFFFGCLTIVITMITFSGSSWANSGWPWRMPKELAEVNNINMKDGPQYIWGKQFELTKKTSFDPSSKKEKVLIVGDSQSADLINILSESGYIDSVDAIARTVYFECNVLHLSTEEEDDYFTKINPVTTAKPDIIPTCKEQMAKAFDHDLISSADKIFVSFLWGDYSLPYNARAFEKIKEISDAKLFIFGKKDLLKSSVDIVNSLGRITGIESYASQFKNDKSYTLNLELAKIPGTRFIDMMKLVCPQIDRCLVLTNNNKPIYYDQTHTTKEGAEFFGKHLLEMIRLPPDGKS